MQHTLKAGFLLVAVAGLLGSGCSSAQPQLQPRSVVNFTGERIQADPEAMAEVETWLRPQLEDIERNPSFLIRLVRDVEPVYPWSGLEITADTAEVTLQTTIQDAETPYLIYAHYRLMDERGELGEWLPEGDELEGFELEQAMLERIADLWLLGRSVFDTQAHGPLDELLYAREAGYLREFILASQPERFAAEREAHYQEHPEREGEFREWFLRVFEAEGPRYVSSGTTAETPPT